MKIVLLTIACLISFSVSARNLKFVDATELGIHGHTQKPIKAHTIVSTTPHTRVSVRAL